MKTLIFISALITISFSQQLNIIVKTNTYNGQMSPKHTMAIWIQDKNSHLVEPLLICSPDHNLKNWRTVINQKDTSMYKGTVQPTIKTHDQSVQTSWNCKSGIPKDYELCIEFTEDKYTWNDTIYNGKFIKKLISLDTEDKTIMEDSPHISFKATYISPDLIYPPDNAMRIKKETELIWKKYPEATSYDCQISVNSDFSIPVKTYNVSDTSCILKNLNPSTKYYWRVKNDFLNEWSPKRTFNTSMRIPTLISPKNDTTEIKVRYGLIKKSGSMSAKFLWNSTPCSFYDYQISVNPDFSSPVINFSVKDTFLINDNLDLNTKYYWRVRAVASEDTSEWSETRSFITVSKINIKIYDKEGRAIYSYSDLSFRQPETHIIKKTRNLLKNLYLIEVQIDGFCRIKFKE